MRQFISRNGEALNWLLLAGMTAVGFVHPHSPSVFFSSLAWCFGVITVPLLLGCGVMHLVSRWGARIQGPRRGRSLIAREIFETVRCTYTVAAIAAWPATLYRLGLPNGLVWTVAEAGGSWILVVLQFYLGVVLADFWTYWKHRMLHTQLLFPFHRQHHSFRDPTPFAGFAISPVEAVLTFWPIWLLCHPAATHFGPLYFGLIGSFVVLNFYLHCGVTFRAMEWLLPKLLLNSSAWHNVHHAKSNANFGEISFIWDKLLGTSDEALTRKRQLAHEAKAAVGLARTESAEET